MLLHLDLHYAPDAGHVFQTSAPGCSTAECLGDRADLPVAHGTHQNK